ncbi:methyltransferase FkbM family [Thalassoporum mexicanum PCC 7367]|uniref:FkbM family methyltransferase n=1 Tax=Thalassoporum mexicanum TaxID=3457544 RepID=UPI00029FEFCC|nr:FkbM family methyltransferase [Pseudanabaena sp. PCC 7367]AFY71120.1 methyltransferase FkbM family [Pseudanabaena sp. PCC 7367]
MNISKIIYALPRFFRRHSTVRLLLGLFPNSQIQLVRFNQDSAQLFANITDPRIRNYFVKSEFDQAHFFDVAIPFLAKGGVFFDVGANFGFCSFGVMGALPQVEIKYHLFEANADIYSALGQSASLYTDYTDRQIVINHCCVSDHEGVSKLNIVEDHLGASFISEQGNYQIKNLVIDNYVENSSINKINFMKLDIEGWEPLAIKGAMRTIQNGTIDAIYTEVIDQNLSRSGYTSAAFIDMLKAGGFELFYFKQSDLNHLSDSYLGDRFSLDINGYPVALAKLKGFPAEHHSDILAIHKNSGFI